MLAEVLICFSFLGMGLLSLLAAVVGHIGKVCEVWNAGVIPRDVAASPILNKRANQLVAYWCTGGAILSIPPVIPLYLNIMGGEGLLPLWQLGILAVYGFILIIIISYPFEKIKELSK